MRNVSDTKFMNVQSSAFTKQTLTRSSRFTSITQCSCWSANEYNSQLDSHATYYVNETIVVHTNAQRPLLLPCSWLETQKKSQRKTSCAVQIEMLLLPESHIITLSLSPAYSSLALLFVFANASVVAFELAVTFALAFAVIEIAFVAIGVMAKPRFANSREVCVSGLWV